MHGSKKCVLQHLFSSFQAQSVLSSVQCDLCGVPAKHHCNTCGDTLCNTCKTRHLKSRGTKHHIIVPYAEKLDPELIAKLNCHKHVGNIAEYWCETCQEKICLSCITNEHRGHEIFEMTKKLSNQRDRMVEELKTLRDSTISEWEDVLRQAKEITFNYPSDIEEIEKELVVRAEIIHKQVNEMLSNSRQTLKDISSSNLIKLKDQEKYIEDKLKQLKNDVQQCEDQLICADPNAFLKFKPGSINSEEKSLPILEKGVVPRFTKGSHEGEPVQEISVYLTIECFNQDESKIPTLTKSLIADPQSVMKLILKSSNLQLIACDNSSGAWVKVDDGTILLMNIQNTITVKPFVTSDMAALTANGDFLSTDLTKKIIERTSRNGVTRILFKTEQKPIDLCCLLNGDIVVIFDKYKKVMKYNITGEKKEIIYNLDSGFPEKVAYSKLNQDIHIIVRYKHKRFDKEEFNLHIENLKSTGKVITIGDDKHLKFEYNGDEKERFDPMDVCADHMGNILIAVDSGGKLVHILDKQGKPLTYIHLSRLGREYPYRLTLPFCSSPMLISSIDVDKEGQVWVGRSVVGEGSYLEVFKYMQQKS